MPYLICMLASSSSIEIDSVSAPDPTSDCRTGRRGGGRGSKTYVATGEVTTLEHELGDDTVEAGSLVSEALLTSAESAEVLGGLGSGISAELHDDAAKGSY